MSLSLQAKLLRVLEERVFERVGGTRSVHIDFRLISATNKDPTIGIREGWFRADLYYRLNVIRIILPPLRHHKEDIPLLINHFIREYARKNLKGPITIADNVIDILMDYSFPGNIRELKNVIQRAIILARGETIHVSHLPEEIVAGASDSGKKGKCPDIKCTELLSALKKIDVSGNGKHLKLWQDTLKCTSIDKIHEFLVRRGSSAFSRIEFTRFLEDSNGSNRNKYGTAGKYLCLLKKNRICIHNGKKANQSRYRLSREFVANGSM